MNQKLRFFNPRDRTWIKMEERISMKSLRYSTTMGKVDWTFGNNVPKSPSSLTLAKV